MHSSYCTPYKTYYLKTNKYICNEFGLAEFFSRHFSEFETREGLRVLDAGCGAMPMGIFLADQYRCDVTGVDLNPVACSCAEENIEKNNLSNKAIVIHDNLINVIEENSENNYDLIVANPPIDDKFDIGDAVKYKDYSFDTLNDELFSFLTNSWHSADGRDMVDYIFESGEKILKQNGKIILVFCNIDCDSPKYVYDKAIMAGYKVYKVVDGIISAKSIGADFMKTDDVCTWMVEFRR